MPESIKDNQSAALLFCPEDHRVEITIFGGKSHYPGLPSIPHVEVFKTTIDIPDDIASLSIMVRNADR